MSVISGYSFPALKESDAMFAAETAPEWKDADCCSRCRATFGMVQRKVGRPTGLSVALQVNSLHTVTFNPLNAG